MLEETATELDDLLDELTATELEDLLEETTAAELDDLLLEETTGVELATEELVVPPHTADVSVAPFLPTPATCAILSFTHCGAADAYMSGILIGNGAVVVQLVASTVPPSVQVML
mgnify:CR=1 FL=1